MRAWYVGLFCLGLLIVVAAAVMQTAPGYMDADYYYAGSLRIAAGQGATEPYLWNYLNDPSGLPGPSFAYWMPLVSLIAALGLKLNGALGWWGARIPFFLLAGLVPPLTALLASRLTGKPRHARLAGLLALFPAFYLAYLPTTDAFPLVMVLGTVFLLLAFHRSPNLNRYPVEPGAQELRAQELPAHELPAHGLRPFLLGLLAGLFHLTRADGLLWLGLAFLVASFWSIQRWRSNRRKWDFRILTFGIAVLLGYVLVMAPWFARNLREWGSFLPPGGGRALWITEYEQTMIFPPSLLTPENWLAAGWGTHFSAWGKAFAANAQTALAVQGMIVLLPFILAGLWHLRACPEVRLGVLAWLLIAGAMTFLFPFAGINGGFFHSGATLQPLWWAVAPMGMDVLIGAYARKRRLPSPERMLRFMSALVLVVAVLLSGFLYTRQVVGGDAGEGAGNLRWNAGGLRWNAGGLRWNAGMAHYRAVEQALVDLGAQAGDPVMVNNPPGYWLASGRPAAVIPNGGPEMLLAAARRIGGQYVVLEDNDAYHLSELYDRPEETSGALGLEYLGTVDNSLLFRISPMLGEDCECRKKH